MTIRCRQKLLILNQDCLNYLKVKQGCVFETVYDHCYINGKRNQGRQPKKWMDNVNEDMEAKKQWFWCGTETNGNIK